jgi:hypothetical protein
MPTDVNQTILSNSLRICELNMGNIPTKATSIGGISSVMPCLYVLRCTGQFIYMPAGIVTNYWRALMEGGVISTGDQHYKGNRISAGTRIIYG